MVVDKADDNMILGALDEQGGSERLIKWLLQSRKRSFVFTTRTKEIAIKLSGSNVVSIGELKKRDARELLKSHLLPEHQQQLLDDDIVDELVNILEYLALSIVQTVAYINVSGIAIIKYISLFKSSENDAAELLNKEFED